MTRGRFNPFRRKNLIGRGQYVSRTGGLKGTTPGKGGNLPSFNPERVKKWRQTLRRGQERVNRAELRRVRPQQEKLFQTRNLGPISMTSSPPMEISPTRKRPLGPARILGFFECEERGLSTPSCQIAEPPRRTQERRELAELVENIFGLVWVLRHNN